ncbi:hypothetical protein NXS19_004393 [Fusarium pseudograminearum]|nr:hypothetical protein HYE68_008727 [Fusarium pseudograminearum]UZP36577.1 hypothetical protein NXS19_004393 [Fusarium pseudograminearum]
MSDNPPQPPKPKFIAAFNFRIEQTGAMIDLAGGIGPVISYGQYYHETNKNQIWSVYMSPYNETLFIKSEANQQWLVANGHGQRVTTGNPSWSDENAQWVIRGGDIRNLTNDTTISIWSVKYPECVLDLEGGKGPGSPILTYKHHSGPNQIFKLWKRW